MMIKNRYIILIICLLHCTIADAQTSGGPQLSLQRDGESLIQVHFSWQSGPNLMLAGWNFSVLTDDWNNGTLHYNTGRVGAPDLPTASVLMRLPVGSTLTMNDFTIGEYLWREAIPDDFPLAPVVAGWAKDHSWPGYEPDEKTYSADAFYRGGEPIEIKNLGVMGNEQLFRLTLHPVAYNPVSRSLLVDTVISATLGLKRSATTATASRLLIVSRPEFEAGLQPFVQWKQQEGYIVEELYVNTHRRDSIKAQIRPYFERTNPLEPAPDYLLIVGDAAQIQSFEGETMLDGEGHTTDLYYSEFTGDYLPEAMLGRWPVNDTDELSTVVEKTLRYEQFRNMDTLQLKRMLLVAGNEQYAQAPLTTNGQVNYVSHEVKLAHPEIDTLCYHNPQSANQLSEIQSDIGQGAGLLNYTAHCTVGGWTSPALSIGRVAEASGTQPMVYVNNCCKSNIFSGTGFGEQLLRLPTGGAVGVIGATNSTLWNEDYYWAVGPKHPISLTAAYDSMARGAFDALVGRQPSISTMGELLTAGNLAVTEQGSSYAKFYWEVYCLLGDPTLRPWIGVPQPIDLETDNVINGQGQLYVSGTPGVRVTAMQGDELLGMADIGNAGFATLELRRTLDTLPLIVTATGIQRIPRIDTLAVETSVERGVTLRNVVVGDSMVTCTVENIGNQRYDSLRVIFNQTDGLHEGALLEEQVMVIDSLLPHGQIEASLPVSVVSVGQQPLWQATLSLIDDSVECSLELTHIVSVTYPTLTLRLQDARGREARRLWPGRDYSLTATIDGEGDSLSLSVEAFPSGDFWTTPDNTLAFTAPDSLCSLAIDAESHLGLWHERQRFWLEPGNRIESFEHGFESHPWRHDNHVVWILDDSESHSGLYSARSGAIGDGQTTKLCLDVELLFRDTISYWVKTSTEGGRDKMIFSVDGRDFIPEAWGISEWSQRTHLLEAGHHTLCWRYRKDDSGSQGSDCVWIDDLQIPLAKWDTVYAWDCLGPMTGIVDAQEAMTTINLYPNPAFGEVWFDCQTDADVRITDALGRILASFTLQQGETRRWDSSALPTGVYFATIIRDNQKSTYKLILLNP
ncbi:MAG: T9SS type A sorting domain-containing protein [Bacteroidales bacterium]|nr:T9SS type A sorting domain-containing protein [Bacteroidales bacterium]